LRHCEEGKKNAGRRGGGGDFVFERGKWDEARGASLRGVKSREQSDARREKKRTYLG